MLSYCRGRAVGRPDAGLDAARASLHSVRSAAALVLA